MSEFEGVAKALGQALTKRGYSVLTPVQTAILAPELEDADVLVSAQTGSGKTVAFGLSLAPTLLAGEDRFGRAAAPLALAVAPTRELALQVKRELDWLYEMTGAVSASCIGGMDMGGERRALNKGAHIVVGTPGRLRDHIERGSLNVSELRAVVLDEADEMLDLGFREDLEFILDAAPSDRRTLMFSATVPRSIATLAKRYQRNAVRVATTEEQKQHLDIEYRALAVAPNDRENAIINLLRYYDAKSALVFCATRATVNHMTSRFANRGFSVVALSGELSQNERTHALQAMRDGRARVCIATDVAARGIDLPDLELVIHADIPKTRETLLHRSGRTGRAGRKGVSALIVPHNMRYRTERLLDSANLEATWGKAPSAKEILARDRERTLADPVLSDPLTDEERAFAAELLERYSPEQIAGAFLRQKMAGMSAPEELLDTGPGDRKESRRDAFKGGVWFSLSVGHKQNAEPRWLLPMLCRAGHMTKREIGAIRIFNSETFVELSADSAERFVEELGSDMTMEKTIRVARVDGLPDMPADGGREQRGKTYQGNKPAWDPQAAARGDGPKKKKFSRRADARADAMNDDRPPPADRPQKPRGDKPWDGAGKKAKGKTSYKVKKPHRGQAPGGPKSAGDAPVKRKKPKKHAD
ncbi:MAG: ATP-dependent RNA helicase [Rhodospirillaceae bacterium]|nr:ATP-dependent RNA helicase [Magnetovibrio sp.]MAY66000.1 ATP-dependent RNA helicase [Rhodospirillaceae bacterium]